MMATVTGKRSVGPLVEVGTDIFSPPIDTPVDLSGGKNHPRLEDKMPVDELQADEMGTEIEEAYHVAGDPRRDKAANAESDDDLEDHRSSEASSSEYKPSERSKAESAFDDVGSETSLGLEQSPRNDASPIAISNVRKYRAPFLNETYDDYKEWHMMSDGEDAGSDQSSIFIQQGYYGDSLDGPDGSQPIDDPSELDEGYKFNISNPSRNFASSESAIHQGTVDLNLRQTNEAPNKRESERESESIGDSIKFPPAKFDSHGPQVYHPPTTTNNHLLLQASNDSDKVKHGRRGHNSSSGKLQNDGQSEVPAPPPLAMLDVSRGKGKEQANPLIIHGTQIYNSYTDNPRSASGQISKTFNAVNDFGGMSDQDEDKGAEYLHVKSSPLKDGRRLDNQKGEDVFEKFEPKPTSDLKIRTRVKNKHLPAELTQPIDAWKLHILPTFFNWLASQEDPWNQPPSTVVKVLETFCRATVRGNYTLKRDSDTSGAKSPEYKWIAQKISDWKSKLGSTAIWAINTIFECRPEKFGDSDEARVAWADWHQDGYCFLFADIETSPPKGIFQSNAFLHVLGAHFALFATDKKAWVLGLTHDSINREPWGAIAIAAAVVERAVVLWSNRDLTVKIMKHAAKSKSHSIDFPKKMNAKGVETQSHALFAEPKWGPRTQYYYLNIKARVKKGTWNWTEIYGLLEPHIKALQKREKSKSKLRVEKPAIEVTTGSADVGDDDLLEDAADMSAGSLSFQSAPPKP